MGTGMGNLILPKSAAQQARVAVCIPVYGYLPVHALIRMTQFLLGEAMGGHMTGLFWSEDLYVSAARNDLARDAIQAGFTHMLFVDQDVVFAPGTIRRLLSHRRPIVSAVYYQKIAPHLPVAGNFSDDAAGWAPLETVKRDALQRADVVGLGCCLIEAKALLQIGTLEDMSWFDVDARGRGEDIAFCRRAKDAGVPVYVDGAIDTAHVGTVVVHRQYHERMGGTSTPEIEG